ncbi:MAG: asparagine synthase-related protein, partial [Hyphomicrobiales bacterium]
IPPKLKIRALREKHILRQSVQDLLPTDIGNRPKQPYRAPDGQCFTGPQAPDYVEDALSEYAIRDSGYFEAGAVRKLLSKGRRNPTLGTRDNLALVGILSTQIWHRTFTDAERRADTGFSAREVA